MGQLTNQYVSQSYQGLLKMTDSTTGVTGTLQTIQAGDGTNSPLQMSTTQVNISGSLTVNGAPISIDTGSFATTGSNTFIGNQIIQGNVTFPSSSFVSTDNVSGALYFSSLNNGTLQLNTDGGEGDVLVGYNGWGGKLKVRGDEEITGSLGVTNIKGTGSLFLQPDQGDARFVEIYNTSPTDTHITASGGQLFMGNDVTYVKVDNYGSVKRIDIVADNAINVSGSMSVTGSIDITGDYYVNGVAFSGGTNGTSGTSGTSGSNGSSGTSGGTGSSGTSGTSFQSPYVGNVIITGSLNITGSVGITGSVQGNVNSLSIASQTASLNLNDGNFFTLQLVSGSATNINPSNIKAGQTINILLNTTGSGTVSFPTTVKQVSGSAYVPTTTTSKDVITLISFDNTNLYLANVKNLI